MKAPQSMTAAELVAELESWKSIHQSHLDWYKANRHDLQESEANHHRDCVDTQLYEITAITAELEKRCEDAGILIDPEGMPVFFNFDYCTHFYAPDPRHHQSSDEITGKPVARVNVKAEDVKDLLGYLLSKGGKG